MFINEYFCNKLDFKHMAYPLKWMYNNNAPTAEFYQGEQLPFQKKQGAIPLLKDGYASKINTKNNLKNSSLLRFDESYDVNADIREIEDIEESIAPTYNYKDYGTTPFIDDKYASVGSRNGNSGDNKREKRLDVIGAMYANGLMGYADARNGTPAWWLNQAGRGIANTIDGKPVYGGIAMASGLIGAGLSGVRDVMTGVGSQHVKNFARDEGMARLNDEILRSREQEYLRNKQANGESFYGEDGGRFEGNTRDLYEMVTGKEWNTAKKEGLTDGSYKGNMALRKKLMAQREVVQPKTVQRIEKNERGEDRLVTYQDDVLVMSQPYYREQSKRVAPDTYMQPMEFEDGGEAQSQEMNLIVSFGQMKGLNETQTKQLLQQYSALTPEEKQQFLGEVASIMSQQQTQELPQ